MNNNTTLPKRARETSESRAFSLRVLYDGGTRDLPGPAIAVSGTVTLGRTASEERLSLRDPTVSRTHATLTFTRSGAVTLTDRSTHGTFVRGQRVTTCELADGDVVRMGDSFVLVRALPATLGDGRVGELFGVSPIMAILRASVALAARDRASVLVLGESGTGKELVARALHRLSGRSGPFVAVNVSSIPETLFESQLFGHVAGAFTGAVKDQLGFLRAAHGGTLFLDETGDLPKSMQPKLLRVLEERRVTPMGSVTASAIDVRVVTATHRDIPALADRDEFRADLYSRIAELTLRTPALRDHREDILPLFHAGLMEQAPDELTKVRSLDPELVDALLRYDWPLNVRELLATAKELRVFGIDASELSLSHAPELMARLSRSESMRPAPASEPPQEDREPPTRERIVEVLKAHKGNVSAMARELGRSRRQVHRYLSAFGLSSDEQTEQDC